MDELLAGKSIPLAGEVVVRSYSSRSFLFVLW